MVSKAVPLWNQTLTPLQATWRVPPRLCMEGDGYAEEPNQVMEDGEIFHPEPGKFKIPQERLQNLTEEEKKERGMPEEPESLVDLRKDFGKLQIIMKLANIHLTSDKPEYKGGVWHVEGQLNESMQVVLSSSHRLEY